MSHLKYPVFLFILIFIASALSGAEQKLKKIVVSKDGGRLETADGKPFIPWGINYFRPETGWAPKIWRMFDPETTRKDFQLIKKMGGNCVRVFLTYNEFLTSPDKVNESGLKKLDEFLKIAEETGIYVHPTGPDHWEGLPEWARGDRICDDKVLRALELFWQTIAQRYKGRNVLLAYDLLNEPSVPWDSPQLIQKWKDWVSIKYGDFKKASEVWAVDISTVTNSFIPGRDLKGSKWLKDFQELREEIAVNWVRRQAAAIKGADNRALVTVGLIQWSIPLFISNPSMYAAFRPSKISPYLDLMEIHFYPLAGGVYTYQDEEAELRNLAYSEALVSEMHRCNKPVVLAEFGWYGGGTLPGSKAPAATEQQQARWCENLVQTTRGWVCGWIHWGLYDHPTATDVTRSIGLFKSSGEIKEWGRAFERIGKRISIGEIKTSNPSYYTKPFPWEEAIVDPSAAEVYFKEYYRLFKAFQGKQ